MMVHWKGSLSDNVCVLEGEGTCFCWLKSLSTWPWGKDEEKDEDEEEEEEEEEEDDDEEEIYQVKWVIQDRDKSCLV